MTMSPNLCALVETHSEQDADKETPRITVSILDNARHEAKTLTLQHACEVVMSSLGTCSRMK
jgi:hypothetical protein